MNMPIPQRKTSLDKDLRKVGRVQEAALEAGQQIVKVGIGLIFLAAIWVIATVGYYDIRILPAYEHSAVVVAACIIGGYMALNIGANDVANNVGPAVGSRALTLVGALVIAALFETAGAVMAGGDVVTTIKQGIIDPTLMPDARTFIWAMMAAVLAAALWLNLATYIGAPVSTTHSIVGGVMGAGIAATGFAAVNWVTVGKIAASWVISPVVGGVIAAAFLAFIKSAILFKEDKVAAARRWVPVLVAVMAAAFSVYLVMKGLKRVWKADLMALTAVGVTAFVVAYALVKPAVARASQTMENRRKAVTSLFTVPLIFSAALLSFAHGANDVANAVGPLAAIVDAASSGGISGKVDVPIWVMLVGAVGISAGLMLFGPKLIRTVGEEITRLDRARAFCVALSAAITVIIASALGLPVSSTHIAVGGIFGVGFLREYLYRIDRRRKSAAMALAAAGSAGLASAPADATANPGRAEAAANSGREEAVGDPDPAEAPADSGSETINEAKLQRKLEKARSRRLVRRSHLMTIVAAWLVTVPLSALLAALLFVLFQAAQ